jgi:hypothetical protein
MSISSEYVQKGRLISQPKSRNRISGSFCFLKNGLKGCNGFEGSRFEEEETQGQQPLAERSQPAKG